MAEGVEPQTLSSERRSKMLGARDGIIERLSHDLPTKIDLERFLNVVVSEIGRMTDADRCDLIQLNSDKQLTIGHEWRRDPLVPRSEGLTLPIDAAKLAERIDIRKPIRINDTSKVKDPGVKMLASALNTRSLLIIPVIRGEEVLGLLGLHATRNPRVWLDDEVELIESIARQLAIGYQYTSLFAAQEKEAHRTTSLLEIANTLNRHSDFKEVAADVLERAIGLVGADYGALGVLDASETRISLASFKSAQGIKLGKVMKMIE